MDSKLKDPALKIAGWGLLHGDFFDLYDVAEVFDISNSEAAQLMVYLRTMRSVEMVVKVRRGLREKGKSPKRIVIKVFNIHHAQFERPQPNKAPTEPKPPKPTKPPRPTRPPKLVAPPKPPKPPKPESLQQKLARLVQAMPSPPESR